MKECGHIPAARKFISIGKMVTGSIIFMNKLSRITAFEDR